MLRQYSLRCGPSRKPPTRPPDEIETNVERSIFSLGARMICVEHDIQARF